MGKLLARYGSFCVALGRLDEAKTLLQTSLNLADAAGDQKEIAFALATLGGVVKIQGELELAQHLCEQSLALIRPTKHRRRTAYALDNLATIAFYLGNYQTAKRHHTESLAINRAMKNQADIAYTLNRLGMVAFFTGAYDEAEACFAESLDTAREIGHLFEVSMALGGFGWVAWGEGKARLTEAKAHFETSLALCREISYRYHLSGRLSLLGRVVSIMGQQALAQQYFEEALTIAQTYDAPFAIVLALTGLGQVCMRSGDREGAEGHLCRAVHLTLKTKVYAYGIEALIALVDHLLSHPNGLNKDQKIALPILLKLLQNHPTTWYMLRRRVSYLTERSTAILSPAALATVQQQAQNRDLWIAAADLLATLQREAPPTLIRLR